jgi:hypothetical protein
MAAAAGVLHSSINLFDMCSTTVPVWQIFPGPLIDLFAQETDEVLNAMLEVGAGAVPCKVMMLTRHV